MSTTQSESFRKRTLAVRAQDNWPLVLVAAAFTALWLPHVFIINESLNFAMAFEVDPGGMLDSVLRHLSSYNMGGGYFSTYYGWSFFFIAFWILKPIVLILHALRTYSDSLLFCLIRLLNFFICLASVVVLYLFLKRLFKNVYYAALACIFYFVPVYLVQDVSWVIKGSLENFFYFIHPEPTGFLFLFLSLWWLELFNENSLKQKPERMYFVGVLFMALAFFAKQPFFFVVLPIYALYVKKLADVKGFALAKYLQSREFAILFVKTILMCLLLFYIMNPYAFLQPRAFAKSQLRLVGAFGSGPMTLSLLEAWKAYLKIIGRNIFLLFSIAIVLIDIVILLLRRHKEQAQDYYFMTIFISLFPVLAILISNARYFILVHYLAPVVVFFLVADIFMARELLKISKRWIRRLSVIALSCIFAFSLALGGYVVIGFSFARLNYKDSNFYRVYEYLKDNIPNNSKVAVSHTVAIPPEKGLKVFQWWQNDVATIGDFDPDYLIYQQRFGVNGVLIKEAVAFNAFVSNKGYRQIATLEDISVFGRK